MGVKTGRLKMRGLITAPFDIRSGEVARALLMFTNLLLVIASFYILKPVRSSVFLVSFGPQQLPYVFILIALVGAGISWIYSSFARRVRLNQLMVLSSVATAGVLICFRFLLHLDQGWVSYALYVVVSLYGVITTSQFWLLANHLFDAREARRLFGFIGAGGILGALAGSAVASTLATSLEIENLILVAAILLGFSAVFTAWVWPMGARLGQPQRPQAATRPARGRRREADGMRAMVDLIRESRHLTLLTSIIGISVIASTIVDYVFSTEAYNHFAALVEREHAGLATPGTQLSPAQLQASIDQQKREELTRFFGRFQGVVSVISLVLQLAVVGPILANLGVGAANLFLPLGLLAAAGGMWIAPALFMVGAARLVDGALSYSINRAGVELLFIPVPAAVKNRTKTFIDLVADRLARGVAGALLLILTGVFAMQTRGLAAVLAVILLLWLYLAVRMRGEYLTAFRRAISGRTLDVEGIREMVRSPDAVRTLADGLAGDERQVVYTLTLLESADSDLLVSHLVPLLTHPSPEVRRLAMRKLAESRDVENRPQVERLIADPDRAVRREAARYLVRSALEGEETHLRTLMVSPDWRARGAALEVIAENAGEHGGRGPLEWIDRPILDSFLAIEEPNRADARGVMARAIGALGPGSPHASRLEDLLADPDPGVRAEAMAAASEIRDPRYLNHLLLALAKPRERKSARLALAAYGKPILPILSAVFDDETTDLNLRAQIPGAVGLMRMQPAVDFLLERSAHPLVVIRFQVIKALGKTRAWDLEQRLRFEPRVVEARLLEETRNHFELHAALSVWGGGSGGGRRRGDDDGRRAKRAAGGDGAAGGGALLRRALGERLDMNLERIFRLLGLRYPAEDMLFAYNGVVSERQATRASAIEFLDNLLSPNLKRAVLPVVAGKEPDPLLPHVPQFQPARNQEDVLRQLLSGNDSWLAACAIDAVQEMGLAGFERELAECRASRDPIVQEAAAAALGG